MREQRFTVEGMTCGHCVHAVTEAVHNVDHAAEVGVDLSARTVTVHSAVSEHALRAAITDAGYQVLASAA